MNDSARASHEGQASGVHALGLAAPAARRSTDEVGSRFAEVWRAIAADPYATLPDVRLRPGDWLRLLRGNVYRASRRTLESTADLLPPFDKLVHPGGICLAGSWHVSEPTPYTGLFRGGSRALAIVRASDSLGEQRPGKLRLLGLAGKLYPTTDPDHPAPLRTANFFAIENLGGSHTRHFAATAYKTDLVPLIPHPGLVTKLLVGALAGAAFMLADRALSPTRAMMRQLYPIAELGEPDPARARAPAVMRLVGAPENRRIDAPDLREELAMHHHPDGLRFAIQVSDRRSLLGVQSFRTIGALHLTQSVASWSGDHRLHFPHPPYRPEGSGGARRRGNNGASGAI